ncbi:hypothetical protein YC2023_094515 [Brassica napus]
MSGSKNSVRKWKVLDHGDSDDVLFAFAPKRQHSCSGLLMLATVNVHRLTTYVCFLLQYSYGPRPQPSSKIVELAERIAALSPEERKQIGHALSKHLRLQEQQMISF